MGKAKKLSGKAQNKKNKGKKLMGEAKKTTQVKPKKRRKK